MVQQQNMRSIWRSRKASGGTFPHLRDERQNQKDRMYKSESREPSQEREREQSMAASMAARAYLFQEIIKQNLQEIDSNGTPDRESKP